MNLEDRIREYIREHPGSDLEDLFDALDVSLSEIAEACDRMLKEGKLEFDKEGGDR